MRHCVVLKAANRGQQKGVVSLLFALLIPLMLGFAAFAVDLPYFLATRTQMQTTADAAALAGGRYLGEGGAPNWDTAIAQARAMLASNPVAGQVMQATVQAGYWDISSAHQGLRAVSITPTGTDIPAIQVSIAFNQDQNNGELKTVFAHFIGIGSLPITVSAVSARAGASTMGANVLFPLAIPQCMYDTYWNASASPPGPRIDPSTKSVYVFQMGTSTTYSGCNVNGTKFPAGAWAAATSGDTSSSNLLNLITNRISQSLSIGDQVFVNSGNYGQSLYTAVNSCSAAAALANQTCRYVTVAVFNNTTTTGYNTITGFACIEILSASGGSSKSIVASMSTRCATPPSSGIGPSYGVMTPPKLFL